MFNRDIFFAQIKTSLFGGRFTQQQVDGLNYKMDQWEAHHAEKDLRWFSYAMATGYHETSKKMWPIEEYGRGAGMAYGKPDPETKQTYFGRGDVQLTWRDNYARATKELGLNGGNDLEWHADRALDPKISADVMYTGMIEGWFRSDAKGRQTFQRYFGEAVDDSFNAREIINGDKNIIPSWSNGVSIGKLIAGYHSKFLAAVTSSWQDDGPAPTPTPTPANIVMQVPRGTILTINGKDYLIDAG